MALTKKAADKKYDKLRKKLKAGEITQETIKRSADRIYKMYHSDANKATRNAKPAVRKPAQTEAARIKTVVLSFEMGGQKAKSQKTP